LAELLPNALSVRLQFRWQAVVHWAPVCSAVAAGLTNLRRSQPDFGQNCAATGD
jgi:hypothetical protein